MPYGTQHGPAPLREGGLRVASGRGCLPALRVSATRDGSAGPASQADQVVGTHGLERLTQSSHISDPYQSIRFRDQLDAGGAMEQQTDYKPAFDLTALTLAGAVTVVVSEGPFDMFDFVIGAILWIILSSRDTRSMASHAYSAVRALCLVIILAFPMDIILLLIAKIPSINAFVDGTGNFLRSANYLPDVSVEREWLAGYSMLYSIIAVVIWFYAASEIYRRRTGCSRGEAFIWWRNPVPTVDITKPQHPDDSSEVLQR
jgi:hypothetical protein